MKISTFAAGVALSALMATGALAADVYTGDKSMKDDANFASPSVVNWTGFYVGVQGGYGNANHNLSVNEYFKDYCTRSSDTSAHGFEDSEWERSFTVDNKKKWFAGTTGETCETLKKLAPASRPYAAGSHATVSGDSRELGSIDGVNSHGFIGGGRLGFDLARGRLLFGVFADYNLSAMETNVNVVGVGAFDLKKEDEWTIGGRIGYIVAPRTLAYVLAGYTQTEYSVGGLDNALIAPLFTDVKSGATFDGVTVGGGIEFALTGNVFFGLEYKHTFYGEETLIDAYNADSNQGLSVKDDLDEDTIMATLKIKLNSDSFGR